MNEIKEITTETINLFAKKMRDEEMAQMEARKAQELEKMTLKELLLAAQEKERAAQKLKNLQEAKEREARMVLWRGRGQETTGFPRSQPKLGSVPMSRNYNDRFEEDPAEKAYNRTDPKTFAEEYLLTNASPEETPERKAGKKLLESLKKKTAMEQAQRKQADLKQEAEEQRLNNPNWGAFQ